MSSVCWCFFWGVYHLWNECANILSFTAALLFLSTYYAMLTMFLCATHIHGNLLRMCGVLFICLFFYQIAWLCGSLKRCCFCISIAIICERLQHSFVWHLTFYASNCKRFVAVCSLIRIWSLIKCARIEVEIKSNWMSRLFNVLCCVHSMRVSFFCCCQFSHCAKAWSIIINV